MIKGKSKFPKGKILVVIYSLLLVLPFYFAIITALKPSTELFTNPIGWPTEIAWENFRLAIEKANIIQYSLNSILVTAVSVVIIVVLDVICAYGLFKLSNTKLGGLLYGLIILGLIIPVIGYASILGTFKTFGINNIPALIVMNVATSVPFAMLILVGFLKTIPKELIEAAKIDGCTDLKLLFKILIPIIKPAIATIVIVNVVNTWNSFMAPLLLLREKASYTIPIGLMNFKGQYSIEYNLMFASLFIVAVPLLIVFIVFQKKFTQSLAGSVKG